MHLCTIILYNIVLFDRRKARENFFKLSHIMRPFRFLDHLIIYYFVTSNELLSVLRLKHRSENHNADQNVFILFFDLCFNMKIIYIQ